VEKADPIQKTVDSKSEGQFDHAESTSSPKKPFVTPKVSIPVDVLEATTYFQLTDSGSTN
jgi:hypothetical protein